MDSLRINSVFLVDPSRTITLRQQFMADVTRRFRELKKAIRKAVVDNDVFGLVENGPTSISILAASQPRQFAFSRSDQKVDLFMKWLDEAQKEGILAEVVSREGVHKGTQPWTNKYIYTAYQKGINRARQELKSKGYDVPTATGLTPRGRSPVTVAMNRPFHAERVALLYTRTFNELKGITAAMDQQISRTLAQGLAEGRNPLDIAKMLTERVDKIGITRARTLARTEVIAAHHRATIGEYREWGAEGIRIMAEWLTAGGGVCELCAPMQGKIFSLDEIEGMIPFHPNCRCVAIPVEKEEVPKAISVAKKKEQELKKELSLYKKVPLNGVSKEFGSSRNFFKWRDSLSPFDNKAIANYKVANHLEVNRVLRTGTVPSNAVSDTIKGLDNVLSSQSLKDNYLAYRGAPDEFIKMLEGNVGKTITEPGFMSTSLHRGTAEAFDRNIVRVLLPKGSNAALIGFDEAEILIARGSKFEVYKDKVGFVLKLQKAGSSAIIAPTVPPVVPPVSPVKGGVVDWSSPTNVINQGKKYTEQLLSQVSDDAVQTYKDYERLAKKIQNAKPAVTEAASNIEFQISFYRDKLKYEKHSTKVAWIKGKITELQELLKQTDASKEFLKDYTKFNEAQTKLRSVFSDMYSKMLTNRGYGLDLSDAKDTMFKKLGNRLAFDLPNESKVARIVTDFERVVGLDKAIPDERKLKFVQTVSRAHANLAHNVLNVGKGADLRKSVFHELGHFVEHKDRDIFRAATKWRDNRARKWSVEQGIKLDKVPLGGGYGKDEVHYQDAFFSNYVGRVYHDKYGNDLCSEVLSMGFQNFTDSDSLLDFFQNDPEHFHFVMGVLGK